MKPSLYLSGPIYGTTDDQQKWRLIANRKLSKYYNILDPFKRDFRKTKFNTVNSITITKQDLEEVDHSNVVLANCYKPGWGTSMEIFYAHMKGKPVMFFNAGSNPSPWLLSRARNVSNFDNAINELKAFAETIIRCSA